MKIKLSIIILILLKLLISESIAQEMDKEIFIHIARQNWQKAEELTQNSEYNVLNKVVLSQKFLDSSYKDNNFEEIVRFLYNNPDWPQSNELRKKAEEYLTNSTDQKLILNWFSKNKPQTGIGYKFYALASAKLLKENQSSNIIRNGWIYGDFNEDEEKKYYKNYKKYLTLKDNIQKIEEYLWNNDIARAKKSMYLVPNVYKKTFLAEIAAIEDNSSKEALFSRVKEEFYTSGLLFQYLKSKKKEVPNDLSIKLFKKAKLYKNHSNDWCKLQIYYAREFIDQKDFNSSYKIVSGHFAIDNENIREAEWLSGWLAFRFLNKPHLAEKHFQKFLTVVTTPISIARGKYWLARTFAKLGDKQKSYKLYKEASIYSYTFYGQLANVELKENKLILPLDTKIDISHKQKIGNNNVIKAMKLLFANDKLELAEIYAKHAIKHAKTKGEMALLVKIIDESTDNLNNIVEIGKIASHRHVFLKNHIFPTPYVITNKPIEASLTYAIIRQESVFDQYAVSSANAMGLMQLIKNTACGTAKSLDMYCDITKLTEDYKYNIKLGSNHFKDLLKMREGSYILSIASYNADPKNVNKWLNRFGDPRKMTKLEQVIDWLELIPFGETRNYVQRVLENIQVYRTILNKNNHLKLKRDLMVGL